MGNTAGHTAADRSRRGGLRARCFCLEASSERAACAPPCAGARASVRPRALLSARLFWHDSAMGEGGKKLAVSAVLLVHPRPLPANFFGSQKTRERALRHSAQPAYDRHQHDAAKVLAMNNLKDAKPKTVRLPTDLSNRVELAAERECRTFSGQLRYLVAKALESAPAHGEAA